MSDPSTPIPASEVAQVRELAGIGAGHAAEALADLIGRPCQVHGPMVRMLPAERLDAPFVTDVRGDAQGELSGVLFEVEGGLRGVLAILMSPGTVDLLIRKVLAPTGPRTSHEMVASALREVGNILVSHFVSAIGDAQGATVVPSIPVLVREDAAAALASLLATRFSDQPALRLETELADQAHDVRCVLVFVPDHLEKPSPGAPAAS